MDLYKDFEISDVEFVGSKNKYGFAEVRDDFQNAKEIRILTYSKIDGIALNILRNLSHDVEIKIVVAPAGLSAEKSSNFMTYNEEDIKKKLDELKELFDVKKFKSNNVSIYFCFKNHAKLIGTDNMLYIGSANYSNGSKYNFEAGVIVKNKADIQRIYKEYFDNITAVRINDDEFDEVKVWFLKLHTLLDEMFADVDQLAYDMEQRFVFLKNVMDHVNGLIEECDNLYESLDNYAFTNDTNRKEIVAVFDNIYAGIEKLKERIEGIEKSEFDISEEGLADMFEDVHKERFGITPGVDADDEHPVYIDMDTMYCRLAEDCEQEIYIIEYWEDYINCHADIVDLKKSINALMAQVEGLIYYNYENEIIHQGTDADADK